MNVILTVQLNQPAFELHWANLKLSFLLVKLTFSFQYNSHLCVFGDEDWAASNEFFLLLQKAMLTKAMKLCIAINPNIGRFQNTNWDKLMIVLLSSHNFESHYFKCLEMKRLTYWHLCMINIIKSLNTVPFLLGGRTTTVWWCLMLWRAGQGWVFRPRAKTRLRIGAGAGAGGVECSASNTDE